MIIHGSETMTFMILGDWGGMDGAIAPENGGSRMVQYNGGMQPGPHVFAHRPSGCTDGEMSLCFNARGGNGCLPKCGYNDTVDHEPALLVAEQMKKKAKVSKPKFVLNVGDNFYWGGIPLVCGSQSVAGVHYITGHMFDTIYNGVYNTEDLNIAWLSVLGNHDYGGWMYSAAWDQQIAYTWHNAKWRLPAQYWMQHVNFPDKGFDMDILLLDSNNEDARPPSVLGATNLCGAQHNNGANCASIGGPASPADCPTYFANLWQEQVKWTEKKLKASKARWQLIVTHFPCGHQAPWYEKLHAEFGLDLLVTGHTHVQLTSPVGGLMCVISGGGGGILSEAASHGDESNSYGFYEATVDRDHLQLQLINFAGRSLGHWKLTWQQDAPTKHEVLAQGQVTVPKRLQKKTEEESRSDDKSNHTPAKVAKVLKEPKGKEGCGFWCKLLD